MLEIGAYKKLQEVILRDYETFSGYMLERYFREKLAEGEDFTSWERESPRLQSWDESELN